jgi:phosphatidylglycerophosphate synthase
VNHERLQRIRNFQSKDWYTAFVIRPISILLMLVIADWKIVTPNRLTSLANLAKIACAWFIVAGDSTADTVWAVVLIHVGLICDHLDGTVARYRRTFTRFGSFYDKVSDFVTWFLISAALGWRAVEQTGEAYYLLLACASAYSLGALGYMKWVTVAESERLRWLEAKADPAAAVAKRTAPIVIAPPPVRTRRDWLVWAARTMPQILQFEETDLVLWVSIGLLIDRLDWTVWLLFATQAFMLALMLIKRSLEMAKVDRRIRELDPPG